MIKARLATEKLASQDQKEAAIRLFHMKHQKSKSSYDENAETAEKYSK